MLVIAIELKAVTLNETDSRAQGSTQSSHNCDQSSDDW